MHFANLSSRAYNKDAVEDYKGICDVHSVSKHIPISEAQETEFQTELTEVPVLKLVFEFVKTGCCNALHEDHFGLGKTKACACKLFFGPGMSADVENHVAECRVCEKYRTANIRKSLLSHSFPMLLFEKVGADIQ
ncbi:hypothetical protein PR048_011863 [Dryococelus australis]|uniref:RNA-directed DNA polymerase n=1 Tax=Dryococelus australis TaxID=614101 RepID=A0ABQ9HN01_9NEOP|nr:hypothetical protein PR048_011863 [Dryococelus australis]